jgi:nitrogen fixation protein NifU and related proteins
MTKERIYLSTQSSSKSEGKAEGDSSRPVTQFWIGPYNEGAIDQPDGQARVTGPCGDAMEISLKIQGNKIVDSRFQVDGCAVSRACASIAAILAKGKELEEAWDIDEKEIAKSLQVLPEDHQHCAILARDTLRQAIESHMRSGRKKEV